MTSVHSELSQYIENIEKYRKLLDRRSIEFRKVPIIKNYSIGALTRRVNLSIPSEAMGHN